MKYKYQILSFTLLSSILFSMPCQASMINFYAKGTDNIPNGYSENQDYASFVNDPSANFFQVHFTQGLANEHISKISIDLRAGGETNAYFDPSDGYLKAADYSNDLNGSHSGKGFGPVIGSETEGLNLSDVSFSLNPTSFINPVLDIMFTAGSFNVGDILSFGIDIDELNADDLSNQGGGLLGFFSVGLTTTLVNSCEQSISSTFVRQSSNSSVANVSVCSADPEVASVPLLPSILLFLSGLSFLGLTTRNK